LQAYLCFVKQSANYNDLSTSELISLLEERDEKLQHLQFQLDKLNKAFFGKSSEGFKRTSQAPGQTELFDVEPAKQLTAPEKETIKQYDREKAVKDKKNHNGRNPFPENLETVEEIIEPEGDLTGYKYVRDEITKQLDYIPGKIVVKITRRRVYVKISSEEGKSEFKIGKKPSSPIEKGIATAMLLAWILAEKFVYHIPFHRTIQKFKHLGVDLKASTASGWMKQCCLLLLLLYDKLMAQVLAQDYLMIDETPIKVLDPTEPGGTHLGCLWAYYSPLTKRVFFQYQRGRAAEWPKENLKNFKGHMQTDGWTSYKNLHLYNRNIIPMNCMAHARRKFDEALIHHKVFAEQALVIFQKLYAVEAHARENNFTHEQRFNLRLEKSVAILNELETWMKETVKSLNEKSPIAKAIGYTQQRWDNLKVYLQDGRLEIDNNLVENSIRPVALGKHNFLFAGSHEAAQNIAMLYSFMSTCRMQGKDPLPWLANVLGKLPEAKGKDIESFLPIA
jgi:transposase